MAKEKLAEIFVSVADTPVDVADEVTTPSPKDDWERFRSGS